MLIFSKYKYLHVKVASLANVKTCVTVGPISLMANVWPCMYSPSGLPLRLSSLNEDSYLNDNCIHLWCQTSGGPLRLGKRKAKALEIHMHFCGFSQHYTLLFLSLSTWGGRLSLSCEYCFGRRVILYNGAPFAPPFSVI